ncbi:hypothetical protein ACWENR_10450 [Micromonospora sp. NPDC004336]
MPGTRRHSSVTGDIESSFRPASQASPVGGEGRAAAAERTAELVEEGLDPEIRVL